MECSYELGTPEGRGILLATLLASGMAFLMGSAVVVSLPAVQAHFGSGVAGIQWVVSAQLLALTSLLLVGGALGDKLGRKRVFVAGILVYSAGAGLSALSGSILQLVMLQAVQGIGAALMIPQSLAIIHSCFAEGQRGRVIGLWASLSGGVAALGPWVGGWLVEAATWRAVFVLPVPVGLLAVMVALRFVPDGRKEASGRVDWAGAFLVLLGLLAMAYALMSGAGGQWQDPFVIGSLLVGPAALAGFVYVERRAASPLVDFSIFRSSLVTGANLVTLLLYFALNGVIFFLTLNLQQAQGYSPSRAGLALLPPVVIITLFAGPAGALADRIGPRRQMIWGPVVVGGGVSWLAFSGVGASYVVDYLPGLTLLGAGMALTIAPLTKSALSVDERLSGVASGVNNAVSRLAALLAVAVVGVVMVGAFTSQLGAALAESSLESEQRQVLVEQSDRLGAILVPDDFDEDERDVADSMVRGAFVAAFRRAMTLCAGLAFLSSAVSFASVRTGGAPPEPCADLVGQCHPLPPVRIRRR